jgi:uncharacterized membrane protein (GlpM family)
MPLLVKILVSATAVGLLNLVARRNPALGGWLTAFPIIGFLSVLWLLADRRPAADQSSFLLTMVLGLIPTGIVLLGVGLLLRAGTPLLPALGLGTAGWVVITFAVRATGLLGT